MYGLKEDAPAYGTVTPPGRKSHGSSSGKAKSGFRATGRAGKTLRKIKPSPMACSPPETWNDAWPTARRTASNSRSRCREFVEAPGKTSASQGAYSHRFFQGSHCNGVRPSFVLSTNGGGRQGLGGQRQSPAGGTVGRPQPKCNESQVNDIQFYRHL